MRSVCLTFRRLIIITAIWLKVSHNGFTNSSKSPCCHELMIKIRLQNLRQISMRNEFPALYCHTFFVISYMDSNIFFKNYALQDLLTTIVLTCHIATILILQILVGKVTKSGYVINHYNFDIYSLIIHYSSRSSKTPRKMDAYRDPIKVIPKAIYPRLTIIAVIINQLRSLTTCPQLMQKSSLRFLLFIVMLI